MKWNIKYWVAFDIQKTGWKINDVDPNILAAAFKKMKKVSLVQPIGLDN